MIKQLNKFTIIISLIFISITYTIASQPEYIEFGNSLNNDRTQSYNFSRRFDFMTKNVKLLIKDENLKNTILSKYLSQIQNLIKKYSRKKIAELSEENFRYFDLLMFNIIYLTQKKDEGKNLKYSRPIIQPRLTIAFLNSLNNKTYRHNIAFRASFLHDISISDIFYKSKIFTADDKVRFKKFKVSLQDAKTKESRNSIPRKRRNTTKYNNQSIKINRNTDSLLRLINNKMKKLYSESDLIGDLFNFNKQNSFKKTKLPKQLEEKTDSKQKKSNQTTMGINDLIKNTTSKIKIKNWMLILIIILLCLFIIITLKRNKQSLKLDPDQILQMKNIPKDAKTPFEEFIPPSDTDSQKETATKFDILNQMLVNSLPKRYEQIWKISKGGMGIVFGAHDKLLRRKVAIKMILPILCDDKDIVSRFVNEARSVASIDHPNILKIFDVGGDEYPFFVMEYLEGISLDKLISKKKKLTQKEIQYYGIQLADAFNYCHSKNIIHRDIKPANILIVNDLRTAKVVDFGIAKDHNMAGVTQTNASIGSPQYMAPEQIQHNKYGISSDIYAYGMTLFKMATGTLPFNETNFMMKLTADPKHIKEFNPDLDKLLASVIMKCINKNHQNRLQDFKQIRTVLMKIKLLI